MNKNYVTEQNINFSVVEPHYEILSPSLEYLNFLEICTRNCYKSEKHIKIGSAEKLLTTILESDHRSVLEHRSVILEIKGVDPKEVITDILSEVEEYPSVGLFGFRYTELDNGIRLSGNVRMWLDFQNLALPTIPEAHLKGICYGLHSKWPFFFSYLPERNLVQSSEVKSLDENPVTNSNNLKSSEMAKHMMLTARLVGSRAMSHQLVRHRLASYSQESQRYCNYGKKGFQMVIPTTMNDHERIRFMMDTFKDYLDYEYYLKIGVAPEDARFRLPNATKTEVIMTTTLAFWNHVFKERAHNTHAQWEIRKIMLGIEGEFQKMVPSVFRLTQQKETK